MAGAAGASADGALSIGVAIEDATAVESASPFAASTSARRRAATLARYAAWRAAMSA
jgi:hypothetical protein